MTRDYKNYDFEGQVNGEAFKGRMGIAVSVIPTRKVFDHFGYEECFNQIDEYMKEKNLDMFGVSCTVHGDDGSVSRHCMFYSKEENSLSKHFSYLVE